MSSAHMSILKRHGSDSSIIYPHCIGEYPLYMRDALLAFKMSDASTTLCIQKRTQREIVCETDITCSHQNTGSQSKTKRIPNF